MNLELNVRFRPKTDINGPVQRRRATAVPCDRLLAGMH